jgi:glyoxylase-like metal-dependent hydrolase (beta-lactamase superfamily II)
LVSSGAAAQVGSVEIYGLLDAVGRLAELGDAYPEVPVDAWEPYRALYPDLFAGSEWLLPCGCFLLRTEGTTVLVDTGVGPAGLWDWSAEREGLLPSALETLGIGRDDVDVVALTHLHIDHLGWNADESGNVFFPRARYLVHRDALAFARSRSELPHIKRCVESLADRFEYIESGSEVAQGIVAVSLPGHYPGHLGIRIESAGERAFLPADAAVHPALLDHPDWRYVSDGVHDECVATRRRLVTELVDSGVLICCGHYPGLLGTVVRMEGRVVWRQSGALVAS